MPKKSASAHGNAQRNRTRAQKSVQLVRNVTAVAENEREIREDEELEGTPAIEELAAPTIASTVDDETAEEVDVEPSRAPEPAKRARVAKVAKEAVASTSATTSVSPSSNPRSASARMAERRQQKTAQKTRQAATLVTAEHYAYVRRDLIFIAILAIIMFGTLVVLHFVPAIGG